MLTASTISPPTSSAHPATVPIHTWDATGYPRVKPRLARSDDQPRTGDYDVDNVHENSRIVLDFYQQVLGRNSIDGHGMPVENFVHVDSDMPPGNGYWDGTSMNFTPSTSEVPNLTCALDAMGHEMTHGVTEHTAGLEYNGQSGALNESISDVFGEAVEQWHESPSTFETLEGARRADWLIAEDAVAGAAAIRDMAHPGNPDLLDSENFKQPAHMRDYDDSSSAAQADYGGVHINSGIPNKAAYEAAMRIGTGKVARIWYDALTNSLGPNASFEDAARATMESALTLYGKKPGGARVAAGVVDAWRSVGLLQDVELDGRADTH
ncbi:MAG: putative metalloprotease [Thermoleophilia bacterium]|nr:putative metalloprotease [Thermoleophilia bacterium]